MSLLPKLTAEALLGAEEGPAVEVVNRNGSGPVILACEHASNRIPTLFNGLGLTAAQQETHVAWDPGARSLAVSLSESLNVPLVAARFSRLVYDCNRPPDALSAMPFKTEVCEVPGNSTISVGERQNRARVFYEPFQSTLADVIAERNSRKCPVVLVTIHSFTPVFNGHKRDVEVGLLHGDDARLAKSMLNQSNARWPFDCRLNEPYSPNDGVLHTIENQLDSMDSLSIMIEIRNDLLRSQLQITTVSEYLQDVLVHGINQLQNNNMSTNSEQTS